MTEAPAEGSLLSRMKGFNRDFWIINGIELLERGAYYSLAPLLVLFMTPIFDAQGMSQAESSALAGLIGSLSFFLLYTVPLFAAAVAEKTGYRAALVVSFVLLIGGYGLTLVAGTVTTIVTAVVLIGFGAGIFKPLAAAMVSQTTREDQRNTGFAIYYGCINLGAFIFPTGVAVAAFYNPGLLIPAAFAAATALSVVNLVLVLTVFRNVNPPRKDVNVLQAFGALGAVFKQPSFLILLVIYSGFWFMYALNLGFLQFYMVEFARMPSWFAPSLITSLNALVIIVFAPLIAVLTGRFQSLSLITVGILGYAAGLVVLGFSATPWLFVGGILVFSLFELVTHPSYLAYVSKIAPPDKVSVYLGYGFLPIAAGLTLGNSVGGILYGQIARTDGQPHLFWAVIAAVGLVTVAALLVYNTVLTNVRARREGVAAGATAAAPRRSFATRWVAGPAGAVAVLLLIPALLAGATFASTGTFGGGDGVGPLGTDANLANVALDPIEDVTAQGERTSKTLTLPAGAAGAGAVVLSWQDEAAGAGSTNAPDTFRLHVTLPNGTMLMSEESSTGEITLAFDAAPGDYVVEVELVDAGDVTIGMGPLQLPVGQTADDENGWTLEATYQAPASA